MMLSSTSLSARGCLCRISVLLTWLVCACATWAAETPVPPSAGTSEIEDVMALAPVGVTADRVEEFGFRVFGQLAIPGPSYIMVSEVFPNTAAEKAGLRPGELIWKVDGKKRSIFGFLPLAKSQDKKLAEFAAGKKQVTWSLEVSAPGATEHRIVTMTLPSPAPHWGGRIWSPPKGRTPAVVPEDGPLAGRARDVLDNGIWAIAQRAMFLGAPPVHVSPFVGYEWRIVQPSGAHRIWVTQQRGRTEIFLESHSAQQGDGYFLTSPSGVLEKAWGRAPHKKAKTQELPRGEAEPQFQAEVDFWLNKVGRTTGRWPLEALDGSAQEIAILGKLNAETAVRPSADFLKLPLASEAQRGWLADAVGKVGMDEEYFAYTETSRALGDSHELTFRFDPSRALAERCTLLNVDGKSPTPEQLKGWRDEGRDSPSVLGELPALSSLVDLNAVRVFSEEMDSIEFELPVKTQSAEFPGERFQALFRVKKSTHEFERIQIKLREKIRLAGVATVSSAGLDVRFETLDPRLAPQPVFLKMGAGVRVLLFKLSRDFEAKRGDFVRVAPFGDAGVLGHE